MYEAEAKKRQVASGRFAGKDKDGEPIIQVVPKMEQPEPPKKSLHLASEMFKVSNGQNKLHDIIHRLREAVKVGFGASIIAV